MLSAFSYSTLFLNFTLSLLHHSVFCFIPSYQFFQTLSFSIFHVNQSHSVTSLLSLSFSLSLSLHHLLFFPSSLLCPLSTTTRDSQYVFTLLFSIFAKLSFIWYKTKLGEKNYALPIFQN